MRLVVGGAWGAARWWVAALVDWWSSALVELVGRVEHRWAAARWINDEWGLSWWQLVRVGG